jgi:hypothetical protein
VLADSPLMTGLAIAPQGVIGFTAGAFGARLGARIGIGRMLVLSGAAPRQGSSCSPSCLRAATTAQCMRP